MRAEVLYTIGHGNRSLGELVSMLAGKAIRTLVDVRAWPHSSRFPHFSRDPLRQAMDESEIVYHWAGRQLGGRRPPRPDSPHRALGEELRGYADFMDTEQFAQSAGQLVRLAARDTTAILCAERSPAHCHRRLIADYLVLRGAEVIHLLDPSSVQVHQLSPEARRESAELIYDRQADAELPW